MCYSSWYNARTMLPAGSLEAELPSHRPATSWVHYTTSCNTQYSTSEDEKNNCAKHAELTGIINKPLLFASGCLSILFIYHCIFLDWLNSLNLFLYRMSCIS